MATSYPRRDLEVLSGSKLEVYSFKKGQGIKQILNHHYMSKDFLQKHCHSLLLPKYANYSMLLFVDQTLFYQHSSADYELQILQKGFFF